MYSLVFLAASSLMICFALTPLCRDLFQRAGLLDHPDQFRKTHARPIPRTGGIPIAIAYLGSFALLLLSPLSASSVLSQHLPLVWKLLPAAGVIFATGLIDDLIGLESWQKLAGQVAAALCAYWGGVQVLRIAGYSTENWWSVPLTVGWLVACTNAFNLIDGVDGLAAGLGLFATLTSLIAALAQGNLSLALATAPLAGALLGFLRYNFNPASIFLGDSGSLLVGFLLGSYGVLWSQKSATLLAMTAPLMALAIPILDVCLSIARRFLRQKPIFAPDRGHIHHRLLDRGLSPRRVALLLYAVGGLGALCSVLESLVHSGYSILILALFCGVTLIFVRSLGYVEFGVARDILLGGAVRRLLGAHIHLQNLETSLAAAATPNDCWLAIRDTCRHLGFHHVRIRLLGETYQEQIGPDDAANYWTMRIPLPEDDYVNCGRQVECAVETTGIATFAHLLGNKLRAKLPYLRPSASIDPQIAALVAHVDVPHVEKERSPIGAVPVLTAAQK
jgi:UDP-GlcNAc:undecaprenyl-phosphate/decaprenyl-phosphate GlcNAc-1-phosphate transferase